MVFQGILQRVIKKHTIGKDLNGGDQYELQFVSITNSITWFVQLTLKSVPPFSKYPKTNQGSLNLYTIYIYNFQASRFDKY